MREKVVDVALSTACKFMKLFTAFGRISAHREQEFKLKLKHKDVQELFYLVVLPSTPEQALCVCFLKNIVGPHPKIIGFTL